MNIRPSSLPMLAACPCWQSDGGDRDYTSAGTARHTLMAAMLGSIQPVDGQDARWQMLSESTDLSEEETDAVRWAAEYIVCHSPTESHPMYIERKLTLLDDEFRPMMTGTPDVTCGPELFDLKWRERDYAPQMAAYALAMMQENGWDQVNVHVLFAERKHAQTFLLDELQAARIVGEILAAARSPDARPRACDYCGWCARRMTCPEQTAGVVAIAGAREDIQPADKQAFTEWLAAGAHASQLADGQTAGTVLRITRQVVKWAEAVEHHCKELATKQGVIPAGFKLQNRQGNRYIASVADAFARAGLPQEEFLKACSVGFTDLVQTYMDVNGMKKAQAERTVSEKLGEVVQRKSPSVSLVADKEVA